MKCLRIITAGLLLVPAFPAGADAVYEVGDIVSDFVLPNRLGYDTHLYDYLGDAVLLVFYSDG